MPVFEYVAIGPKGKTTKGSVDSESARTARVKLKSQGFYPTEIKEVKAKEPATTRDIQKFFQSDKVSLKSLCVATRQLATLVGAGIPLVESLQALSEQAETLTLKRIVTDVKEHVEEGSSLAKSLQAYPKAFPKLYVNMIASGEASGTLDKVLLNLAEYLEQQVELRRKITSALFYPALMLSFCSLVIIALVAFVVPQIVDIFIKQGATLPLPTRIMIFISNVFTGYWYLLVAAIFGGSAIFRWYYKTPDGRSKIDNALFHLPIFGGLYQKVYTARISQTLSTMLTSGVGLLSALDIVKNMVGNVHVTKAVEEARDGVRDGKSLAKEFSRSGLFPPLLSQMIAVGERSGRLEPMLEKAGKAYESEVNASISGLTSLLEPLMIIMLGMIVLSIVASVLLPMVDLMDILQK